MLRITGSIKMLLAIDVLYLMLNIYIFNLFCNFFFEECHFSACSANHFSKITYFATNPVHTRVRSTEYSFAKYSIVHGGARCVGSILYIWHR